MDLTWKQYNLRPGESLEFEVDINTCTMISQHEKFVAK